MKILVSDYDNTYDANNSDLKENNYYVRKFQEKGNIFVIATGRTYEDYKQIFTFKEQIPYDYLIVNNGATLLDRNNYILFNQYLNREIIDELVKELDLSDHNPMQFYSSTIDSRVSIRNPYITKIRVGYNSLEEANRIYQNLFKRYKGKIHPILIPTSNSIEIVGPRVNKAQTIARLAHILNLQKDSVYTIGDSYNDLEMLDNFHGTCIKGCLPSLKEVCEEEIDTVAELIKKIM